MRSNSNNIGKSLFGHSKVTENFRTLKNHQNHVNFMYITTKRGYQRYKTSLVT